MAPNWPSPQQRKGSLMPPSCGALHGEQPGFPQSQLGNNWKIFLSGISCREWPWAFMSAPNDCEELERQAGGQWSPMALCKASVSCSHMESKGKGKAEWWE